MFRGRTMISKILLRALVSLLLCGIAASEFPELLSLTDNTSNDFTVRRTDSLALHARLEGSRRVQKADIASNICVPELYFSLLSPLKEIELVVTDTFILDSVL